MLGDLKTDAFDRQHHTYPASYPWVFMDSSLYGSSRSTETYLRGEELWFESHITMVRQNRSNLHIRMLKLHGYINLHRVGLGLDLV